VRFAQLEKENDWENIRKFWDQILGSMYGIGIPINILMILIAKPLILLMFTREYADAVIIFQINSIAMLFHLLNPTLLLRAMDRNDVTLKVHLGLVILMPPALFAGMKLFGLPGIIGTHAIMLIGGRVINHTILNRLVPPPSALHRLPKIHNGFLFRIIPEKLRYHFQFAGEVISTPCHSCADLIQDVVSIIPEGRFESCPQDHLIQIFPGQRMTHSCC